MFGIIDSLSGFFRDTPAVEIISGGFMLVSVVMMFCSWGLLIWSKRINAKSKKIQQETSAEINALREIFDKRIELDKVKQTLHETEIENLKADIRLDASTSSLDESFKKIPRYNELNGKFTWYLFNLQSLYFNIKNLGSDVPKDFDIFAAIEVTAKNWIKKPDDVWKDYLIIAEYYSPKKVQVTNSSGEVIGHASAATEVKSFSVGEQE